MKTGRNLFASFIFIILFIGINFQLVCKPGDPDLSAKVDSLFSQFNNSNSPGCAVGIMQDGEIIYERGYGLANLEYGIPITPKTIFHIASVSKQFTAFSIVLLAQQGKISLGDDIRKYLPEVPDFGKKITIRNLIYHTSGLRDQWELLLIGGWRLDDVITQGQILKLVSHQKELNFSPGDEYMYCNTGYTLLAEIVSRVSGKSFDEFTRENIFNPLEMENTHFHLDHQEIVKNRAYSYNPDGDNYFKNAVLSYANGGATSLFTNIDDMAKWINNFSNSVVGGKEAINQMMERGTLNSGTKNDYAFGIVLNNYKSLSRIVHDGGDAGFRTNVSIFPDQNFAVMVFANLGTIDAGGYANKIADIYLADKLEQDPLSENPKERKEIEVNPEIYNQYTGSYQLFPGFILTFTKEENKLIGQATGQHEFQIFPESENEFFLKVVDAQITFEKPVDGVCNKIILHQNGQHMPGNRVEVAMPSIDELKEFEGDFYSDELGTTVTMLVKDSSLYGCDRRNEDLKFIFSGKDTGTAGQGIIKFLRDEENRITGMTVSTGRVRNLKFVKLF
jgi:CubicO group peptidase (beta-lactamase class C family)